jgi:hypothetical protein
VALVVAIAIGVTLVELSRSGTVKSQLGSTTFLAGRTRDYAPQIASQGPILLPDPLGGARNVYLQHLGPDPRLGWVTIVAVPPGEAAKCVVRWQQSDRRFHDPCSDRTYPADGAGLTRYPSVALPSDRIRIDLRTPLPPGYTVTTGTTQSP